MSNYIKHNNNNIPHCIRFQTWRKHFITMDGYCIVCTSPISADNFTCGHIVSKYRGGTLNINNLEPICVSCNSSMKTQNLYEYKKKLNFPVEYFIKAEERINKLIINHLLSKLNNNNSLSV